MNVAVSDRLALSAVDEHILRTLLYFDIFQYPLNAHEVCHFLGVAVNQENVVHSRLLTLTEHNYIYRFEEFFGVRSDPAYVHRRVKGNAEAERCMSLAQKQARRIARFPFVRGVLGSGSLSKGYMDEYADLDFFIITAPGRLWIARTLLVLYKRIFLGNSHKYFCVNYFVDERHLEIEEQNLFTATELATALPLQGANEYRRLQESNPWLLQFFPNFTPRSVRDVPDVRVDGLKKWMEAFLNLPVVSRLERHFQKITLNRWKTLYEKDYPDADFAVAFKTKTYASKNHPRNYQRKVMESYADKLKDFGLSPLRCNKAQ
ncbi:hypothetical protein [Chryseolinea lacunae]|uniref:Nucleotidyltransferase n=1 Tax=Chryseolinea lacunae TaxID=2801331 RepID=A0ABS1KSS1_9BACT|nr:hypothetical protein [Chryseolinea lacunae]MBL0742272.1 hypothetical protein [Chryseolinea lacunae]